MTIRVPVVYKDKPLMPMKIHRAYQYVREGKAKWRFNNKLKVRYIILLEEPSNTNTQPIHLGIDPGSHFDGFSVVSEYLHHNNYELIHNKGVKKRMDKRRMYRRLRRSKLRHRPIRFDTRTAEKLVPTIQAMVEYRKWMIRYILNLYPINKVIIEDVAFDHSRSRNGKYFSLAEIGKNALYDFIRSKSLELETYYGNMTKNIRIKIFGSDLKVKDKDSKVFEAHCIDSFSLASIGIDATINILNKRTIFIEKIWYVRKELHQHKRLNK